MAKPQGVLLHEIGKKRRKTLTMGDVDFDALADARTSKIKPGAKLYLMRRAIYADSAKHSTERVTIRKVAEVKRAKGPRGETILVIKFKGVKQPGYNFLRGFRASVKRGVVTMLDAGFGVERPVKYEVLGLEESLLGEADARLRSLERKAAQGDTQAAIALGRELQRAGRPTYDYWSGLLKRNPRSIPLRVMWLNAAQREDEPAYVYSTIAEETWYDYQYFIQTSRNDGIEEEELGPYDSEYEADQAGRAWWGEMRREDDDDEFDYDYEVIDRSSDEPERETDELVDDEEATLEELLYELEQRGMYGDGDDGRWYSEGDNMDPRTGRDRQYYVHVRYLIPYAPHDMLTADSKRIAGALKRGITDAERVPMLDPDKVRR